MYVLGGKKFSFFRKFGSLHFLVTTVLRFDFLPYRRETYPKFCQTHRFFFRLDFLLLKENEWRTNSDIFWGNILTHSMPLVSFYAPWKPLIFWCFQGVHKEPSTIKWVNGTRRYIAMERLSLQVTMDKTKLKLCSNFTFSQFFWCLSLFSLVFEPFSTWCRLKGHTHLNKPAVQSYRFV